MQEILLIGYSVLLSDVDVVTLRDPFRGNLLHRDADVEGTSDGFDQTTAYGWDEDFVDPAMGWSRSVQSRRPLADGALLPMQRGPSDPVMRWSRCVSRRIGRTRDACATLPCIC